MYAEARDLQMMATLSRCLTAHHGRNRKLEGCVAMKRLPNEMVFTFLLSADNGLRYRARGHNVALRTICNGQKLSRKSRSQARNHADFEEYTTLESTASGRTCSATKAFIVAFVRAIWVFGGRTSARHLPKRHRRKLCVRRGVCQTLPTFLLVIILVAAS